ncbi:MAG: manganese efflux pump [Planctomycetota bacterium]|jgi:putative Mn2+ efflux pump MntP
MPVALIGGITFIVCLSGVYLGKKVGHIFENRIEMIGGIILFGIGAKILVEHLIRGY